MLATNSLGKVEGRRGKKNNGQHNSEDGREEEGGEVLGGQFTHWKKKGRERKR